jgi:Tol biopolymer transport system component
MALVGLAAVAAAPPAVPAHAATASGRILYARTVNDHYQLFTIAPNGKGERQLTHGAGDFVYPDWSPDGRRIVFEFDRPNEKGCAVTIMNADGSGIRDLSGGDADCDQQPVFTPNGRRIVFVRYVVKPESETIVSIKLDGSDVRKIGGHIGDTDPNISPDGKTVTFVRRKENERKQALFAINMDGSGVRKITSYAAEVAVKHDWSPNGRRIVMTINADWVRPKQSANAVTIRPDGSHPKHLTDFKGGAVKGLNAFVGGYSPNGKHIALRIESDDIGGLAVMNADGSNLHFVTEPSASKPRFIDWGPISAAAP